MNRKLTVRDVVRAAKVHGGLVVRDGCGGWEMLAPLGKRWVSLEVYAQPLPLNEAESHQERQDMLQAAIDGTKDGVE